MIISVITPCHNTAQFIEDCLESVQESITLDHFEIEHIVVDDNSTDLTEEKVKIAQETYSNLTFLPLAKQGGASAARNAGLKMAKGKYVFFLDADDVLFANSLRYLFETAEEKNEKWVYGDFVRGNEKLEYVLGQDYFGWPFQSTSELLTSMYCGQHFFQQNNFFLKRILDEVNGFTEGLDMAEDFDLATRLLIKGDFPSYLKGPLYVHRLHSHNASQAHVLNPNKHRQDISLLYQKYATQIEEILSPDQKKKIENYFMDTTV